MHAPGRARLPDAPAPGMFQVISLGDSSNDSAQQTREYKRRRSHKKSRGGCLGCKQRRVKCDQTTPSCLRCRRNQRQCVYEGGAGDASVSGTRVKDEYVDVADAANTANAPSGRGAVAQHAQQNDASAPVASSRPLAGYDRQRPSAGIRTRGALVPVTSALPAPTYCVESRSPFTTGPEFGTPSHELALHYEIAGQQIFSMPNFLGPLLPLTLQFPHLRGTLLAASACHLTHKAPGSKNYHYAKHYQQSVALHAYQTALRTPFAQQGQLGVDVLLMTAMLMNMLSFSMPLDEDDYLYAVPWDGSQSGPAPPCVDPDPDPRRSWVFSPHENRLGWLAVQMGLTPLLVATRPWHANSRLRLLFANSDDERRTLSGTWQSLNRVPQAWLDLFGFHRKSMSLRGFRGSGVTTPADHTPGYSPGQMPEQISPGTTGSSPSSTSGSSPDSGGTAEPISEADRLYRAPLRVVAELRTLEANGRTLLQYFQFIGQLDNDFRQKLYDRDEKALWLFGMWMGLMCRFPDVWWTRRRTRCDFRAIRLWLHLVGVAQRPGDEGRLWRTLLKDLDGTWGYEFDADPIIQRMRI